MQCPKCGFDQPRDRFCAQCGVDVSLYQRRVVPSFLGSRTFLIGATSVILCVLVVLGMIKMVKTPSTEPDVSSVKAGPTTQKVDKRPGPGLDQAPVVATPQAELAVQEIESQNSRESIVSEDSPEPQAGLVKSFAQQDTATELSAASGTEAPQTPAAKWAPTGLRLSFFEVSFESFQAALGISSSSQLTAGIIRFEGAQMNIEDKFKSLISSGSIERHGVVEQRISFDEQNPNEFNFLSYDQRISSEIGLSLQFRLGTPSDTGMTVAMDGRRLIGKPQGTQVDMLPISKDLTLLPKSAIYLTGLIENRDPVDQNEYQSFLSNQFLSVFKSEKFRNKQTGVVIVIEVDSSPK